MAVSNSGIKVVRTNSICSTVLEENPKKPHKLNPAVCYVRRNVGAKGANSFIHFPAPVPREAKVISATLTVTAATAWGPAFNMSVIEVNEKYAPSHITWAKQPSVTSHVTTRAVPANVAKNSKVSFDVTQHVKNSQTKSKWYGFKMYTGSPDHTNYRNFYGAGANKPTLTVVYTLPIDKPTKLTPGSEDLSRVIYTSTRKPTYSAIYDDNTSTAILSQVQIQVTSTFVGATPSFSTLVWNPGWINSTTAEIVSEDIPGAPTFADDVKYAWRVRFKSNQGVESPWSDPVIVQYAPQIGVSINKTTTGPEFGNLATNPSFEAVDPATKVYVRRNHSTNPVLIATNLQNVSVPGGGTAPDVLRQGGGGAVTNTGGAVTYVSQHKTSDWPIYDAYSMAIDARNASSNNTAADLAGAATDSMSRFGLVAGKTYTVSASMFMQNHQTGTLNAYARSIRIDLTAPSVNGGVQQIGWKFAQGLNSLGVQRLHTTFTLPADTTAVRIVLVNGENSIANGGSGGKVWWSGFLLEEGNRLRDWFSWLTVVSQSPEDGYPTYKAEDAGTLGTRMYAQGVMRMGGGGPITGTALGYRAGAVEGQNSAYNLAVDPTGSSTNDTYVRPAGDIAGSMARLGLVPGKEYTISADIFIPEAQTGVLHAYARSIVLTVDVSGTLTNYAGTQAGNVAGGVYRVSDRFFIPADATNAYISLYNGVDAENGKIVHWDNLRITEDESSSYVDGSVAGWSWTGAENASTSSAEAVVYTSSPTFTWSITGGYQEFAEVILLDPDLPTSKQEIWSSGRIDTDVQEVNLPGEIIKFDNKQYRLTVRIEDDRDREPTHNSTEHFPVYAEDSVDFMYITTTDVPRPLGIDSDLYGPIHVELTWSVLDEPDMFELLRDGEIIESSIIPDSVRAGDRTYKYIDNGTISNYTHTWEIRSIVDEKTSAANPTTSKKIESGILWLFEKSPFSKYIESKLGNVIGKIKDQTAYSLKTAYMQSLIPIAGEAPAEFVLYEKGETFEPLNGVTPVRITEALGGYRGSVTGTLCGECLGDGTTSRELQNRLLKARTQVGKVFTLHLDNVTIPVIIYNVNTFPKYGAAFGKSYGVTFEFFEVR